MRKPPSASLLADWRVRADPDCAECGGEGVVCYTADHSRDGTIDVKCECVKMDEPDEDDDPWSGGFAENH